MIRDITLIVSVLISVVSVGFGVYKNIEANNAKGYAYEQAYRVLGVVQQANIGASMKAAIADSALGTFGTPPPAVDLSRSSADISDEGPCTVSVRQQCTDLGGQLADANMACLQDATPCPVVDELKASILRQGCFACF